jgi:lipid II:glycine glycyltransferase (peptidoglycan interpeptide bridge formation enzyme)
MHYIEQTKTWAEFRKIAKNEQYFDLSTPDYTAIIQKMNLPFNKCWLYCNRGPIFNNLSKKIFTNFLNEAKKLAKKENAIFLRIEPPFQKDSENSKNYIELLKKLKFRKAHASYQPQHTLIIDLSKSKEEILAQMKQKGRYNIRLAKKKGVKIKTGSQSDIDVFFKLLNETTMRDKFKGHDKNFYKKMLEILGAKNMAKLYLAEYEGIVIAAIIVTFYKDTATYYYGASSNKYRNVMAPYLLQWQAICEAKNKGMRYYDFLGIAPLDSLKNHPWRGVTEFKRKFGGQKVDYVKAREYVFNKFWYFMLMVYKKITR